ncbi:MULTISPECIES: flagellar biosynthesis protein FlhF [unclassified Anaerobiospirillum]|uniref:flagellar biosynthesis protein FlhF n=1 Tax=unclassified Anaerobiospirillum TaxID=2647410 RepID=UPI001FF44204|nr:MULTISPECIES: flagellar biosynthesis protein FlhF [unclassified Anaerobiospirillum]MCK0526368.1 flagellar biosynthesis protein FlhF [Anaerobiospirillum sp. NML120449]MCK0535765.1 flagellar biosynthesis protein FlhF [Anaerobiospirillum sp. NML120511]MCK0540912.1 flagellar biosynthesis protein FlhF [Anaerobiospirillum sp. NML02-A-032]
MKLKRFVAKDMREALTRVKDELGDDAIIMSNKRVADGIEIVAGVESLPVPKPAAPAGARPGAAPGAQAAPGAPGDRQLSEDRVDLSGNKPGRAPNDRRLIGGKNQAYAQSLIEILERQKAMSKETGDKLLNNIAATREQQSKDQEDRRAKASSLKGTGVSRIINPVVGEDDDMANDPMKKAGPSRIDPSLDDDADLFKTPPLPLSQQREFKNFFVKSKTKQEKEEYENKAGIDTYRGAGTPDVAVRQDLEKMRAEVENIRKLLQFELAGLLQDNRSRNEPVKAMVFKLLNSVGFSENVADNLVNQLPAEITFNDAWRELVPIIERAILTGDDEIVSKGGIVTLIGPAGVGKTTTLAKLAARFVMRYGPQRVAIVTADHYRIGAVEQIKTYGRIMGCSTYAVKNLGELPQLLYTLSDKSLILVDTAGVGFKDERFNAQLSQLKLQSSLQLKHYLVLPCTTQRKVLQHAYDHFSTVGLTGLILTKIDECQNVGDALSLCIEMKLPISYITDGQRVPEDLDIPNPNALARRALSAVEDDAAQREMARQ